MPTIDKRLKSGPRYRAVAQVQGKRKEKIFPYTKKGYREALSWEEKTRKKMMNMIHLEKTVMDSLTVIDLANEYLDYSLSTHSKKTYAEKYSTLKRFVKYVNSRTLISELTRSDIFKFLQVQYDKRSGYSANRDRKNLLAAWSWGRKYIENFPQTENIISDIDRFPEVRCPRYIPPKKDFIAVLNLAKGQDHVLLLAALHLAARKGELFNLKVSDIDFDRKTVTIGTKKREGGNTEYDQIPLTKTLAIELQAWIKNRPVNSEYVFVNLCEFNLGNQFYGEPFVSRQHFLGKLCKKAGVKQFDFHSIRHLAATMLYQAGESLSVIQAILRHKSANTTSKYLHRMNVSDVRIALSKVMEG